MQRCTWFTVSFVYVASLVSCVERKEHLAISPNGRVTVQITYSTDSLDELYEGDAVPQLAGGWLVDQLEERDAEGKLRFQLVAQAVFPPESNLPANFSLADDRDSDVYLQFPTTVGIEARADGLYYHFHRLYPARRWAYIEHLQKQLIDEPLEEIKDVDPGAWSEAQRRAVVEAYAGFEIAKLLVFARAAFMESTPEVPQDRWLSVRNDLHSFRNELDYQRLSELLRPRKTGLEEYQREETIEMEVKRFEEESLKRLENALRQLAGYDNAQFRAFQQEFNRQKLIFEITQDLGDDYFEITVEMPGEIVADNAEASSSSTTTWRFTGQDLRDRDLKLMATSRLTD